MRWLNREAPKGPAPVLHSVDELCRRSLELLADCTRPNDERIRFRLQRATTAQQLWLLRDDIYQAIARRHCEAEAARRINALAPAFEGWLPPCMLADIKCGPARNRPRITSFR